MHSAPPFDDRSTPPSVKPRPLPTHLVVRPAESRERRVLQRVDTGSAVARGADYVTIPVAAAMTGYSAKAIRRKIEAGVWLEGREFRRAPDGHVLISVKGYELWVERGRA